MQSELLNAAIDQAAIGDPECGYLIAELLAYLSKMRATLGERNETFRKCYLKWESSRVATTRESPLRPLIHAILIKARREKRFQELAAVMPDSELVVKRNKTLLELPEFDSDPKAVSEWTDKVVYPELRTMKSKLAEDPVIGNLRKALDENGKFQLSRLKPLIKQTVARIAGLLKRTTSIFRDCRPAQLI